MKHYFEKINIKLIMVWLVLIVLLDLIAGYLLLPQSHKEITR
jgi:hypothetical protein